MAHRPPKNLSLRQLVSGTFSLLAAKRCPLALSILSFALLSAVVGVAVQQRIHSIEDDISASAGLTWEQLHEHVDERLQIFTEADARQLIRQMFVRGALLNQEQNIPSRAAFDFMVRIGPWLLFSFALHTLILFVSYVFFVLLAVAGSESPYDTVRRLPLMVLKMAGLWMWSMVRSLLWIPFLGPLIAIYMIPRVALGPAILAGGRIGIVHSVRESMRRTRGRWVSIVLSLVVSCLLCISFLWFSMVIVALLALFSTKVSFFVWLLLMFFLAAFQMFFLATLAASME